MAAVLLTCSGCSYLDLLEDLPVSQAVFYGSGAVVGVPVAAALAPVTYPIALAQGGGRDTVVWLVGPGVAVGGLAGALISAPVLITEALLRAPFRLFERQADRCASPSPEPGYGEWCSVCPYCGADEDECDWGVTCDAEQAERDLDAALHMAWPHSLSGPPALDVQAGGLRVAPAEEPACTEQSAWEE